MSSFLEPRFFQGLEFAKTAYVTAIHFKNVYYYLQYFAIALHKVSTVLNSSFQFFFDRLLISAGLSSLEFFLDVFWVFVRIT